MMKRGAANHPYARWRVDRVGSTIPAFGS